jgi:2'-5' RNA ligase
MKRLFLSVDLSIEIVERLVAARGALAEELDDEIGARWVLPEHIRLTLSYLGEIEEALIPFICERLVELIRVTPIPPFQVGCRRIGVDPSFERPMIVWAGLDDATGEVIGLLNRVIERALHELGLPRDERPFRPLVTLGRLRTRGPTEGMQSALSRAIDDPEFGRCFVKDIVLYEARRDARGPRYDILERFALGAV